MCIQNDISKVLHIVFDAGNGIVINFILLKIPNATKIIIGKNTTCCSE